jgi:eukaryotic-like serine/threonine-protein kinase
VVTIGEVVEGRYKVIRPIADGGMGTVFLAEHWLIKRKVALKILHADLAGDASMIRRFMNEALAAGTLGHPNIVDATDMGFTKTDLPYIVFEYLEGISLGDEVSRLGLMPWRRAIHIATQVASALQAAHAAGIIHRDLKSDNIFLSTKNDVKDHVKVIDFGISRFLLGADKTGMGNTLLGTPEFMAPEQVLMPDQIDHRTDIYALGIVLYEMLNGHVPFVLEQEPGLVGLDVAAAHRLLDRILTEAPPRLDGDIPRGLGDLIVDRLLAKDREARPQTMAEVAEALAEFVGMKPVADRTVSRHLIDRVQLIREVQQLGKRWRIDGKDVVLEFHSREMSKLAEVASVAASIADEMDQQPQMSMRIPTLRLTLVGPTAVTDLVYAARLEQWLREHSPD